MKNLNNGITNPATTTTPAFDEALTELPFAKDEKFLNELVVGPGGIVMRRKDFLLSDDDPWSFRK